MATLFASLKMGGRPRLFMDWCPGQRYAYPRHNGENSGVVPFLKVSNDIAIAVNQGGKRPGALCSYLELWHADIVRDRANVDTAMRRRTAEMDQAQSTNLWLPDSDARTASFMYREAWEGGLKTTYYLRTLNKSGIDNANRERPAPDLTKREITGDEKDGLFLRSGAKRRKLRGMSLGSRGNLLFQTFGRARLRPMPGIGCCLLWRSTPNIGSVYPIRH